MIRDTAFKINDYCVKDLSNSGAITCNLCLELARFSLHLIEPGLFSASLAEITLSVET